MNLCHIFYTFRPICVQFDRAASKCVVGLRISRKSAKWRSCFSWGSELISVHRPSWVQFGAQSAHNAASHLCVSSTTVVGRQYCRTVLTGCVKLRLLVFCDTLWHSEHKARLGQVFAGCYFTECSTFQISCLAFTNWQSAECKQNCLTCTGDSLSLSA